MGDDPLYFFVNQLLHLIVIFACWLFTFYGFSDLEINWQKIRNYADLWIIITALVFLTWPTAYLIGQLTKKWRIPISYPETLENAGKWIGIIERCIILVLVLQNQYEAIGLLIAAKGRIRFNDKDRTEQKTEYLLIGTLVSISISIVIGIIGRALID